MDITHLFPLTFICIINQILVDQLDFTTRSTKNAPLLRFHKLFVQDHPSLAYADYPWRGVVPHASQVRQCGSDCSTVLPPSSAASTSSIRASDH